MSEMNEDFVRELSKRVDRHEVAIDRQEEKINNLAIQHSETSTKLDSIKESLDSFIRKVEKLVERPGKRWDSVVHSIIASLVTVCITLLVFHSLGGWLR